MIRYRKILLPLTVSIFYFSACVAVYQPPNADESIVNYSRLYMVEAREMIWVSQEFSGGKQCEPKIKERTPDSVRLLLDYGVAVYDFDTEGLPVPSACGYPTFRVRHDLLIADVDSILNKAAMLGYYP